MGVYSMLDILITNATILDGTGAARRRGSVGIEDGKITYVGPSLPEAIEVLDIQGHVVAPGFIDVHGHSDLFAFIDPLRDSKLKQGITTEIAGQCGLGPAPVSRRHLDAYHGYFERQGIPAYPDCAGFTSIGAYMDYMETMSLGINLALFIPHGALRMAVMGLSPACPGTREIHAMKALVEEGMRSGALGLSTGLMYAPGSFAEREEIEALCKVVGKFGGIYTSHIRNQGALLVESVAETLDVGRRTGARVNISHHKASGKANWGKVDTTCRMLDEAGEWATHDVYPYTASSTMLSATLPPSCFAEGQEALIARLKDPSYVKELQTRIYNPIEEWDNDVLESGFSSLLIIQAPKTPDAVGKTLAEYAKTRGIAPFDAYVELLVINELAAIHVCHSMAEADVVTLLRHQRCMIGTDALYVPGMPMTHPRAIGTFPRVLGRYVREQNILTLEEAVRRMTYLAAKTYSLTGKGAIREGYDADLVVFDPHSVCDRSDFTAPLQDNVGISHVIVNGTFALKNGKLTGAKAGRLVRVRSR